MSETAKIIVTGPKPRTWKYPLENPTLRIVAIKEDICPECCGELDTGFECNDCGFDAGKEREEYLRFVKAS